jgi:thiol-disulfide isomerase/thioredoxin
VFSYQFTRKLFFAIVILLISAGWIWTSRVQPVSEISSLSAPQVGFLAPKLSLPSLTGSQLALEDFRGSPTILNFWASWCPPCRTEMPAFQQIYQEYEAHNLVIVAVNTTFQDSKADLENFVTNNRLSFYILLDNTGVVSASYNIYSLPTTYFIDSQGYIRNIIIGGPIPPALLRNQVDLLLMDNP